jgi:hypothetical protein
LILEKHLGEFKDALQGCQHLVSHTRGEKIKRFVVRFQIRKFADLSDIAKGQKLAITIFVKQLL